MAAGYAGAKGGFLVGRVVGLMFPPVAAVSIPVATGLGAAGGYLTYEFADYSNEVYDSSKAWLKKRL